jgi:transcriptional regulator with XRE-family HTH domain
MEAFLPLDPPAMTRDAFGPNLRRLRIQRGITLPQIAEATKISVDLLNGLEQNDFTSWPGGIYARAYIRQYAYAIGVDPDATVDEFCRWFPQGDRRALRVVREHAEIVGHDRLNWRDDLPGGVPENDRRGAAAVKPAAATHSSFAAFFVRIRRVFGRA